MMYKQDRDKMNSAMEGLVILRIYIYIYIHIYVYIFMYMYTIL